MNDGDCITTTTLQTWHAQSIQYINTGGIMRAAETMTLEELLKRGQEMIKINESNKKLLVVMRCPKCECEADVTGMMKDKGYINRDERAVIIHEPFMVIEKGA